MFTTQFFVYSMQAFKSIFMSPIYDRYLKEARKLSININVFLGKKFQERQSKSSAIEKLPQEMQPECKEECLVV